MANPNRIDAAFPGYENLTETEKEVREALGDIVEEGRDSPRDRFDTLVTRLPDLSPAEIRSALATFQRQSAPRVLPQQDLRSV